MGILDMLDEASEEVRVIKNHPVQFLSLEEQVLYLQGLSLVMNANDVIVPEQKAHLLLLIRSWELDDSIIEELIHFCQQPNKETIVSFFNTFKAHENKQNFIFDALTVLLKLEGISEQEESVEIQIQAIDKIAKSLDMTEVDLIASLLKSILSKDSKGVSLQFEDSILDINQFQYLAEFYDLEINLLDNDIEKAAELERSAVSANEQRHSL